MGLRRARKAARNATPETSTEADGTVETMDGAPGEGEQVGDAGLDQVADAERDATDEDDDGDGDDAAELTALPPLPPAKVKKPTGRYIAKTLLRVGENAVQPGDFVTGLSQAEIAGLEKSDAIVAELR